jgi:hypothetical protein
MGGDFLVAPASHPYKIVRPLRIPKQHILLKLLAIFLLVCSFLGWVRFFQGIRYNALMQTHGQPVLPLYLMVTGLLWIVTSLVCAIFLWLRYTFALWLTAITATLYTLWYWLDRAFLDPSADRWRGVFLPILLFAILLGFIYSTILYLLPERRIATEGEDTDAKGK